MALSEKDGAMVEYRSAERVYTKDEQGADLSLLYAVGDVIPHDEAVRQGLVNPAGKATAKPSDTPPAQVPVEKVPAKKAVAAPKARGAANKARTSAPNKEA